MTTNTWTPSPSAPPALNAAARAKMIRAGKLSEPDVSILEDEDIGICRFVMQQNLDFWQTSCGELATEDIIALIRFFTLAEEANTEWHGGDQSPVIHLNKLLKQQGTRLDKDLLKWIKARSSNQFLPNGPISL